MNYLYLSVAEKAHTMFIQPLPQASALSASAVFIIMSPVLQLTRVCTTLLPPTYGLW